MKKLLAMGVIGLFAATANVALANEDAELVIDGQTFVTKLDAPADSPLSEILRGLPRRSR